MSSFILKYSGFLLMGLLIEYWIVWHSNLNVSENIPTTSIRTEGVFLLGLILAILIIAHRTFLKKNPTTSILKLTVIGSVICFISETTFQIIRQFFLDAANINERLHYFLLGTIGVSMMGIILSFFVSY